MSMKISQIEDDTEALESPSGIKRVSTLSSYPYSKSSKQNKSRKQNLLYLTLIIIFICAAFYIYSRRGNPKNTNEDQVTVKIQQLADVVNKLQNQQKTNIAVIKDLKKEVQKFQRQEIRKKQLKDQAARKAIIQQKQKQIQDAIKANQQKIKQQQKALQAKPVAPAPKPVQTKPQQKPKVTDIKPADKPKHPYMTPQLQIISQNRRQRPGMRKVQPGSVSEVKYGIKNSEGKKIQEILYDTQNQQARKKFQQQRVEFLSAKKNFQSLYLVSFNNKLNEDRNQQQTKLQLQEYERINKIWNFEKYPQELPMCVVVPGYNNNAKFRIQYNLNSIFQQNYTNYFVVIINDASTDNSDFIYRNYLNFYNIDKEKYAYLENTDRKTALQNIYIATHNHCSPDSVVINLDADDEFIGKNVLKAFNAGYQLHKSGVVYSNFYWYDQGANIMLGFTSEYTQYDKTNRGYRQAPQRFSHLRTYRAELFLRIKEKDFQDKNGKFWTSAYDMVMYFPLMELSCGRVNKIDGFHYLYNINTGLNDYAVDRNKQATIDNTVRHGQKYDCSSQFDARMKA